LGKPLENPVGKYTRSDNRTNVSYFAEHNFLLNKFTLSLGGLLNHNTALVDEFKFFPAVNASYRIGAKNFLPLQIYASWNQATRMPTFNDLYYTTATHTGYANLEAEMSEAFELGAKYTHRFLRANIAGFYIKGRNMIDWVKEQPDALWESRNHTKVDRMGVETSAVLNLAELAKNILQRAENLPPLQLTLGYAYIHQNVLENELISNYTLNHLRHKFTVNLHHEVIKNLTLSWNFRWQERVGSYVKYVDLRPAKTLNYKPFSILDVKANYAFKTMNIFVNANNVFNAVHVDFGNIPQPGRWITTGVSFSLQ
jgi:iron complex outermembrane receptor protein